MTPQLTDNDGLTLTADGRIDGRSARKVETRRRIILAASELFAELGFAGTSMDQIAEAAGVSKGTIFYNFKNKNDLCEQLIRHAAVDMAKQAQDARAGLEGWDALSSTMLAVMRNVSEKPAPAQILLTELFRTHRPWSESLTESRQILLAPMVEVLNELGLRRQQQHGIRLLSEDGVANVAMSLVGAVVVASLDQGAFFPERNLEQSHEVLMQAISGMRI